MTRFFGVVWVLFVAACSGGASAEPGWGGLDSIPLDDRSPAVVEWTGEELIVWGGDRPGRGAHMVEVVADGAAYAPDTGEWRELPPAPLDQPLYRPGAAWTGAELLIVGRQCGDHISVESALPDECDGDLAILAYDPNADSWRSIDPGAAPDCHTSLTWTGDVAAFWCNGELWTVDPRRGETRRLPMPPEVPENIWRWCGGGGQLVAVMDVTNRELPGGLEPVLASVFRDGRWTPPEEIGVDDETAAQVECLGAQVLAIPYAGGPDAWLFDPASATWRAAAPAPEGTAVAGSVWNGDELLLLAGGTPRAYDPAADRWRDLPPPPVEGGGVWVGDRLVLNAGRWFGDGLRLTTYDPQG